MIQTKESLGRISTRRGDFTKGLGHFDRAQSDLQKIIGTEPEKTEWQEELASIHVSKASTQRSSGLFEQATIEIEAALGIYQELLLQWPESLWLKESVAMTKMDIGLILIDQGKIKKSLVMLRESTETYQQLANAYPLFADYRLGLARSAAGLAQSTMELDSKPDESERLLSTAEELLGQLYKESDGSDEYLIDIAVTASHHARLAQVHGDSPRARQLLDDVAMVSIENSLAADPNNPQSQNVLAHVHWLHGLIEHDSGEITGAEPWVQRAQSNGRKVK